MQKPQRRLEVVYGHLDNVGSSYCKSCASKPTLTLQPAICLVDEQIHICVSGLAAGRIVTLRSYVEEGKNKFEARGVYRATEDGIIDNKRDPSLAGTYKGMEPMGLFWSLKPTAGQDPWIRLIKKNVEAPMVFTIGVYEGSLTDDVEIHQTPLTSAVVNRFYKSPSVRRIPVKEGPFRGTIFIPEGQGPFPAVIDAYGALVSLVEVRASLLASHGYAVFALAYLYQDHLAKVANEASPNYFKEAAEWFCQQEYVDEDRLSALGLCYGGYMVMMCAAICPKVKAVVDINGQPVIPAEALWRVKRDRIVFGKEDSDGVLDRMRQEHVFNTDEGIIVYDVANSDEGACIPAYQHGAKILTIVGEDDKQCHPKWFTFYHNHVPEAYRGNIETARYPGAGHLIEAPYSPLCRVMSPGGARMDTVGFIKGLGDSKMLAGGLVEEHAYAQEHAWARILDFLQKNLKELKTEKTDKQAVQME